MNQQSRPEAAVKVRVDAPNQQRLVLLVESELVIGRECEGLQVADPQVSRRHLRLRRVGSSVEVSDLGSTNGSFLDGTRLAEPTRIDGLRTVVIGDTIVTIDTDADRESSSLGRVTSVRQADNARATSLDIVADRLDSESAHVGADSLEGDTVTIVFSDIESSTERATAMGDTAWFDLLDHHNRVVRHELERFGGREVQFLGDGFMLVFPSVRRALRFATSVQKRIEAEDGPDLRVRIGLHTGEAIVGNDGLLFGRHVHFAARVANMAQGGQIVASVVVREIAAGRDDATFDDPIHVELKGFADLQAIYAVQWAESARL